MDNVFVVRHYFYVENVKKSEDPNMPPETPDSVMLGKDSTTSQKSKEIEKIVTVKEWIYRTYKSAHSHAVDISLLLMGIEKDNMLDLEEVRTFQDVFQKFELTDQEKKMTIGVEVNYETGMETELIELENMQVLD